MVDLNPIEGLDEDSGRHLRTSLFLLVLALIAVIGANLYLAQKDSADGVVSAIVPIDVGRQLFVAKGCITCHVNNKADRASEYWTIETGATNLTNFSASPEILRIRLKDPAAAKSDTKMPNLNLSEAEIEALIAFINS